MISVKKYKELLINSNDSLQRALRVLPHEIEREMQNPHPAGTSPKVIKDLQKRLNVAIEIAAIRATA